MVESSGRRETLRLEFEDPSFSTDSGVDNELSDDESHVRSVYQLPPCVGGIRVITVPSPSDFNSTGTGLSVPSVYRWTRWPNPQYQPKSSRTIPLWTNPSAFMKGAAIAGTTWWWMGLVLCRTGVGEEWLFSWTVMGIVLFLVAVGGSIRSGELRNLLARVEGFGSLWQLLRPRLDVIFRVEGREENSVHGEPAIWFKGGKGFISVLSWLNNYQL